MWRVNKMGQEQVWYEAELIEKIKAECQDELTQKFDMTGVTKRILDLIKENKK